MMVRGRSGEQRGNGNTVGAAQAVGQNNDVVAVGDSLLGPLAEPVEGWLHTRRTLVGGIGVALMELMTDRRIRHLPVVEDGQLRGIISIGDVVKWRIAETVMEAEALREYIATG